MLLFLLPVLVLANRGDVSYLGLDHDIIEILCQVIGFAASAALIGLGLKTGWPEVVKTGHSFFVIFRYIKFDDWWWDWMPKYLFFLVIGLSAVFALVVLRRRRRRGRSRNPGKATP